MGGVIEVHSHMTNNYLVSPIRDTCIGIMIGLVRFDHFPLRPCLSMIIKMQLLTTCQSCKKMRFGSRYFEW
jgi:hypothetical protein